MYFVQKVFISTQQIFFYIPAQLNSGSATINVYEALKIFMMVLSGIVSAASRETSYHKLKNSFVIQK